MLLGVKRVKQRRHLYFLLNSYIYFRFVDILYRLRTESCRSWCGFDVTVHATCFQHYCRHWSHWRYFSWKLQPNQCTTRTIFLRSHHYIHTQVNVDNTGKLRYIECDFIGHLNDAHLFAIMRNIGNDLPIPDECV